jgi:uncharacterized MnhB-related membrane protein
MLLNILIVMGTLICAIQAIRSSRLLISALWLAGCSALVALIIYLLGAPEIAVIELSVGAGLVTVIFVFAINIAGEELLGSTHLLPRPVTWALVGITLVLLAWLTLPHLASIFPALDSLTFSKAVWEPRELETLLQVCIIFSGVLGLLGLLADKSSENKEGQSSTSPEVKS